MNPEFRPERKPTRLATFDYASAGIYFITICTQHRESRFGHVEDGEVRLNTAGTMVADLWQQHVATYPGVELDQYVVMPDHLHAILVLGTDPAVAPVSLNTIIGTFKSLTTLEYSRGVRSGIYPPFDRALWQRSYHDRIIRNQRELDAARLYIERNPANADDSSINITNQS